MQCGAEFSPCRLYRYALWRIWDPAAGTVNFIGLNPSTADEQIDDPTIRRCIGFARDWGYGGLVMTNLFAFRATEPAVMKAAEEPVGPDNDVRIAECARKAAVVIAAWGQHGSHRGRDRFVRGQIARLHYLRLTKGGHPGHPLYLPAGLLPQPW
ncbi:MAG: DUF1643 domain-containing protein [Chromatiales bacterium]|nr:DUF1643 domain-containing protein [Chromatiales bacterium]